MQILNLLESRFAPIIAYHASRRQHLRSIIKNGLIPNKTNDGYGSTEVTGYNISLNALSGNYLTRSGKTAEIIGKDVALGSDSEYIIIVTSVQERSAEVDEDVITRTLSIEQLFGHVTNFTERLINSMYDEILYDPEADFSIIDGDNIRKRVKQDLQQNIISQWLEILHKTNNLNEKQISFIKNQLQNLFAAIVDHSYSNILSLFGDSIIDEDTHSNYRNQLDKTTRSLKKMVSIGKAETMKINKPIGFSGSDKIIGIYDNLTKTAWGDVGYFEKDAYHKVKTPAELLK